MLAKKLLLKYNRSMDQNYGGGAPQNQATGPTMPPVNNTTPDQGIPSQAMPNQGMTMQGVPMQATPTMQPIPNMTAPVAAGPVGQSNKKGSIAETIILVVVCLIAAAAIVAAVIFFMKWDELNTDYEMKVSEEVATAQKEQKDADEKNFTEREKEPNTQFTGPSDYGSISFYYPKTWSVYIESDGSNNSDFEAYFAPGQVNSVKDDTARYALRFSILDKQADDVLKTYQKKVQKGEMTSKTYQSDNQKISGTLFEGAIDKTMQGIVLVVKVNDKTAVLQTDAETYRADFEKLIGTLRKNS